MPTSLRASAPETLSAPVTPARHEPPPLRSRGDSAEALGHVDQIDHSDHGSAIAKALPSAMPMTAAVTKAKASAPKPDKTAAEALPTLALSDAERLIKANIQAQDANQRGTRAAEIHPEVLTEAANGSKLTTYTMTVGLGNSHDTPVVNVDRQGPVLAETVDVAGHTVAPYAGMMGGAYLFGASVQETAHMSTNAMMIATPGLAVPVVLQRFHVGEMSLTAGVAALVAGDTGIKALEEKEGWVQLEQTRKRTVGGLLLGGVSNGVVGISGRLTVAREREMVLKRWVKPDEAAGLLRAQDKGMRSYAQNKAIALGIKKPLMQFPDVSDPKSLELRDELVCSIRGSMTGTLALATAAVLSGINVSLSGEFELTVSRRKDETTDDKEALTVAVSPKKVSTSLAAFIDVAVLAELRSTVSRSNVTRQSYQFEVNEPEAMEAYQDLLRGDLPGAALQLEHEDALDAAQLVGIMGEEKLPKGVKRLFAERAEVPIARSHLGGFTLPRFLPYFKWAGLSAEVRTQHARHSIADAESGVLQDEHTRAVEKQKLHYGVEVTKTFARMQQLVRGKENDTILRGITLGAQMTLDRSRNKNRNVLTEQLNNHLLVEPRAESFTNTDVSLEQTYDLSAQRVLGTEELARLVKIARQEAIPADASRRLRRLLQGLQALGERAVTHPESTASLFGDYVRNAGIKGVGEVHRLLGDDSKLTVTPKSSAKSDVGKKKTELKALYPRPIEARFTSASRLTKRVLQVDKAVKEAAQAASDLRQDPLLATFAPETQTEELKAIDSDRQALEELLDTQHLDTTARSILKRKLSSDANRALDAAEKKRRGGKKS